MSGAWMSEVLAVGPTEPSKKIKMTALGMIVLGVVGLGVGFASSTEAGLAAFLTATVLILGLAAFGPLLMSIFEMSGARWGRPYQRLAESFVVLVPVAIVGLLVVIGTGHLYLPWVDAHHLSGGKHVWLVRGFWDARLIGSLGLLYGLGLRLVYLSLRRDFCTAGVAERYKGFVANLVSRKIGNREEEALRCSKHISRLAPVVAISFAFVLSFVGFDLIMSLEPDWFSTLFGAWFFVGHVFSGMALLILLSFLTQKTYGLERFFDLKRQADLATLMFAFVLLTADFFWNQYLTIWYANLPEETFYLVERTVDASLPWRRLSLLALAAFFVIPFVALLFRKFKEQRLLLGSIAVVAVFGIVLARFIEIAPPIMKLAAGAGIGQALPPLAAAVLITAGMLGAGLLLFNSFISMVPIFPVGDRIFREEFEPTEEQP